MDYSSNNKIVIGCSPGLNLALSHELEAHSYKILRSDPKAVVISGNFQDAMKLNYILRCANRVLWHVVSFRAVHPNHLYKNARKVEWEDLLEATGYFSIDSFVQNKFIRDKRFANLKLKDAIADRFIEKTGRRPNTGSRKEHAVLFMRWLNEEVDLFVDTSGQTIAKHGYRKNPGPAPLMENLAAAIIQESNWNKQSHFVNPMCGSGTLAIEAAMMSIGVYPGKFRQHYGFQHLVHYRTKVWQRIADEIESQRRMDRPDFRIIATDHNRKVVAMARENARNAGVDHLIDFQVCDFGETAIPEGKGVVMLNPEYGERMGKISELEKTYRQIGDFLKQRCHGYLGYIFTGNLDLAKKVGLRTRRRLPFYNGKIECRLLEYELY